MEEISNSPSRGSISTSATSGSKSFQFIDEQERRRDRKSHLRAIVRSNARNWKSRPRKSDGKDPRTGLDTQLTVVSQGPRSNNITGISFAIPENVTYGSPSASPEVLDRSHLFQTSSSWSLPSLASGPRTGGIQNTALVTQTPGGGRNSPQTVLDTRDPFDSLPYRLQPHMFSLVDYYVRVCAPLPEGLDSLTDTYSKWLPLCVQNEMALKSLLLAAETGRQVEIGNDPWSPLALALSRDCVRLLRDEIDESNGAVSDAMIATAIHISAIELFWGDPTKSRHHLRGLREMVKLRGGLGNDKTNSHLKGMILYVSQLLVVISLPRAEIESVLTAIREHDDEFATSLSSSSNSAISHELVHILKPIKYLSIARNATDTELLSDPSYIATCVGILEDLRSLRERTPSGSLEEACILAGYVYVDLVLLHRAPTPAATTKVNTHIQAAMTKSRCAEERRENSAILTWVSSMASTSSSVSGDNEQKGDLVLKFNEVVRRLEDLCFDTALHDTGGGKSGYKELGT